MNILRYYYHTQTTSDTTTSTSTSIDNTNEIPNSNTSCDATINIDTDAGTIRESCSKKVLTLEEDIAMLNQGISTDEVLQHVEESDGRMTTVSPITKNKKHTGQSLFQEYDTGCRGRVFLMCTIPQPSSHHPSDH